MTLPAREAMEFDVVIVGAGPAGLAAAIRLKQLSPELGVVVVEKGSEVGAHILSGAVIDPIGLDRLLPEWRSEDTPIKTAVTDDRFYWLGPVGGAAAAELPDAAADDAITATSSSRSAMSAAGSRPRPRRSASKSIRASPRPKCCTTRTARWPASPPATWASARTASRRTASPAAWSCAPSTRCSPKARAAISSQAADRQVRSGGGPRAAEIRHRPEGALAGRAGQAQAGPGAALVRLAARQLDRRRLVPLSLRRQSGVGRLRRASQLREPVSRRRSRNSSASRRIRSIRGTFEGGKRLSYGARAITEGGYQSVPKLTFPGGALIGCAAGFVNVPRIKGSHNAMLSGMLAAEHVAEALSRRPRQRRARAATTRPGATATSARDLWRVRNAKPLWSKFGTFARHRARRPRHVDQHARLLAVRHARATARPTPTTLQAGRRVHSRSPIRSRTASSPSTGCRRCSCPTPITRKTSRRISRSRDMALQKASEHDVYAGPSARYCPAGVYEWVEEGGEPRFVINAQNCVHCKTCDIKDPNRNITWVPPGGRRRAELPEYVIEVPRAGHDTATPGIQHGAIVRRVHAVLAGGAQKGHSAPNSEGSRVTAAHGGMPLVICSDLVPAPGAASRLAPSALLCRPRCPPSGADARRRRPPTSPSAQELSRAVAVGQLSRRPPCRHAARRRRRRRLLPRRAARRSEESRAARARLPVGAGRRRRRGSGPARRARRPARQERPHRAAGARRARAQAEAIRRRATESRAVGARPDHRPGRDVADGLGAATAPATPRAPSRRSTSSQGADWYALFKDLHAGLILDLAGNKKEAGKRLRARPQARRHRRCASSRPTARWLSRNGSKDEALEGLQGLRQGAAAPSADRRGDGRRSSTGKQLPPLVDRRAGRRRRSALRPRRGARPPRRRGPRPRLSAARALSRAATSRWRCCRSPISTSS